MDRLAAMEAFVRVAEARSFSEAARRLGQSKSVVSRQVAALEEELGARLLTRTTRSLALTEAGRTYFERAARILADVDEADASVSLLAGAPRGRLRVNAPMSFGFLHLAPQLPLFMERYPEVEVDMAMNDRMVDLVEEGFDVAVRITGRLPDSSLVARKLAPVRMAIVASPDYLARRGEPASPEELAGHDCLLYTSDQWQLTGLDGKPRPVHVRGRLRANNGDALRAAALAGLGLALLPTFIVGRDLQDGTLVPVLCNHIPCQSTLYAVYPEVRQLSPKVRAFVDFLAAQLGPNPYWDLVR
jgi:DNA-binding transcriptional LysR family regulator